MQRVLVVLVALVALWGPSPAALAQSQGGNARTEAGSASPLASSSGSAVANEPSASSGEQWTVAAALSLAAGQTCLEEARLERRVARWLERQTVEEGMQIRVAGGEEADEARFVLLRRGGHPTERDLEQIPGDCGDLHSAVALSIALAIDASLLGSLGEPSPVTPQSPSPALPVPDLEQPQETGHWSVSAGVGLGFAHLPKLAPGALFAVHYAPAQALEFRMQGRLLRLSGVKWPDLEGIHYNATLSTVALYACAMVEPTASISVGACLKGAGGSFRTSATGLEEAAAVAHGYWSIGAALELRIGFSETLGVRLAGEFDLPLANRTLAITEGTDEAAHERKMFPIAAFVAVAPYLRFP